VNRRRDYGQDLPFCNWLRTHEGLPSISSEIGFVATDVDLAIHRYLTLVDGVGTREFQLMMQLEVKTRSGQLGNSQRDTLYKQHCCSHRQVQFPGQWIHHFGVTVLMMDGTMPNDSTLMHWGRFNHFGRVNWREVELAKLVKLLRFDADPDSFRQISFSRNTANDSVRMYELDDRVQRSTNPTFGES
jgi:hypothetical protein